MKSYSKYILNVAGLLFSALLVSCNPDEPTGPGEDGPDSGDGVPMPSFSAEFKPMSDEAGTCGGKLQWNASDRIKAFVVPAGSTGSWVSTVHMFVTDQENCQRNVFSPQSAFGLEPEQSYDWYVMSPYSDLVLDPLGGSSTCFPLDGQVMDAEHPEAHAADFDIMTAVKKNVRAEDEPSFTLEHKCMMMKLRLVNTGSENLVIREIEVKSPDDITLSGVYSIDFNSEKPLVPVVAKNSATLKFATEKVLEPGETQEACLVMPPFELKAGQVLLVETRTSRDPLENSIVADKDMAFKAGSINAFTIHLAAPDLKVMVGKIPIRMTRVTGGSFIMGATPEQEEVADNDEKPAHRVYLSDYYIGRYEVTQELWTAVMGTNPSEHQGNISCPVDNVSADQIIKEFLPRLNEMTGMNFTLPTEAQWEYAARGGVRSEKSRFSGSDDVNEVCWYEDNSNGQTQPVGTKLPNELGLYDMSGNVWEWCLDWYSSYTDETQTDPKGPEQGNVRILRGGAFNYAAWNCRITFRSINYSDYEMPFYGFRLVLN